MMWKRPGSSFAGGPPPKFRAPTVRKLKTSWGASARYPTANLEAVRELPWSATDYQKLVEQREELIGIPQVPGSYFISRHLTNAFRSVVISGAEPRESLVEYTETINREIADKIDEFS